MRKIHKIIATQTHDNLCRVVFFALKEIYKYEIVEKGIKKETIGVNKKFRGKIDWELAKMKELNKQITYGRFNKVKTFD